MKDKYEYHLAKITTDIDKSIKCHAIALSNILGKLLDLIIKKIPSRHLL